MTSSKTIPEKQRAYSAERLRHRRRPGRGAYACFVAFLGSACRSQSTPTYGADTAVTHDPCLADSVANAADVGVDLSPLGVGEGVRMAAGDWFDGSATTITMRLDALETVWVVGVNDGSDRCSEVYYPMFEISIDTDDGRISAESVWLDGQNYATTDTVPAFGDRDIAPPPWDMSGVDIDTDELTQSTRDLFGVSFGPLAALHLRARWTDDDSVQGLLLEGVIYTSETSDATTVVPVLSQR